MDLKQQFDHLKFLKGTDFRADIIQYGHFGQGNNSVFSVQVKGKHYALKQLVINSGSIDEEIKIMQSLKNSEYVVNLEDYMILESKSNKYTQSQQLAYLLMESGKMNLEQYIEGKHYMENNELKKILEQLINIFNFLQQKNVAHRDIKLENILVMSIDPFQLKACDVGCSQKIEAIQTISVVGTRSYLAPELLNAQQNKLKYNPYKSDVYSLGLCFLYIITLQFWNKRSQVDKEIEAEIIKDYLKHVVQITANNQIIQSMLKKMLNQDPNIRPDFIELKEYFNQLKEEEKKFLSQKTSMVLWDSPKKDISQFDFLSPDSVASRGRESLRSQNERQRSQKRLSNNKKGSQSHSFLNLENALKKVIPSKSPKKSPSHSQQFARIDKPTTSKFNQTAKTNSFRLPPPSSQQQRQQSKYASQVFSQQKYTEDNFYKTFNTPSHNNQILVTENIDALIQCEYEEVQTYQSYSFISLKNNNNYNNKQLCCNIPNQCIYLHLQINTQIPKIIINSFNQIQIIVLEILEDDYKLYKWSDIFRKLTFPSLTKLEIIIQSKQSQINNIISLLEIFDCIQHISIIYQCQIHSYDHKLLFQKLKQYNCLSFEFRIPNSEIIITDQNQIWSFNTSLDSLVLDYQNSNITSTFNFLASALRTVELKSLHLNISSCQSKNTEISLLLEYLGLKLKLNELKLNLDSIRSYDKMIQEKLKNNISKLLALEKLYLSLQGITLEFEFFEKLFKIFENLKQLIFIVIVLDRLFSKNQFKKLKSQYQGLNQFNITFYGTNNNLTIILSNNGFQKIKDFNVTKCNNGLNIKCSNMYNCITCSKKYEFFLKHPIQICSTCLSQCHMKCNSQNNNQFNESLTQSQIIDNVIKKDHKFIQQLNIQDYKCYCSLLGKCNLQKENDIKDSNKYQLKLKCNQCLKYICNQCSLECHRQHTTQEMYIDNFICDCECQKHQ